MDYAQYAVKVVPFTFLGTVATVSKMTKRQVKVVSTLCLLGPVGTGSEMIKIQWYKGSTLYLFRDSYNWIKITKIHVKVVPFAF